MIKSDCQYFYFNVFDTEYAIPTDDILREIVKNDVLVTVIEQMIETKKKNKENPIKYRNMKGVLNKRKL